MVGTGCSRIVSVIRTYHQHIVLAHCVHYFRQSRIKFLDALSVAYRISAMSVLRIEFHKVGKYKTLKVLAECLYRLIHSVHIALCVNGFYQTLHIEYIAYFADSVYHFARILYFVQDRVLRRCHRIIVSVGSSYTLTVFVRNIRSCDNSAACPFTDQKPSCRFAYLIQSFKRNHSSICRNLKYAVRRCVYYRLSACLVFGT